MSILFEWYASGSACVADSSDFLTFGFNRGEGFDVGEVPFSFLVFGVSGELVECPVFVVVAAFDDGEFESEVESRESGVCHAGTPAFD